jgi:hypothetical protein
MRIFAAHSPPSRMRQFLSVALIAASCTLSAQTKTQRADVRWGPELSAKADGAFNYVFDWSDDAVYMKVTQKKQAFVQKMGMDLRVLYKKLLPMKIGKDEHAPERMELLGDRIAVFSSFFNKKTKVNSLYLRLFNEGDMSPIGTIRKVADIGDASRKWQGSFTLKVSPDKEKILVRIDLPYEKDAPERFKLQVYSSSFDLEWEQEVTLPYPDKEFSVSGTLVDDDGSVIVIGTKYAEKAEARELKKEERPAYTYMLLTYDGSGDAETQAIEAGDKFLQDLTITIPDEGDILCGGFYGKKGASNQSGAFYMRLDRKTKAILHQSYKEFSKEFITQYMTEKEEEKASKKAEKKGEEIELIKYDLDELIIRDDGGVVMVGEQYNFYTTTVCTTTQNGGQSCRTNYHYVHNDVVVVNVDPNGNIEWATKIPKRQHTVNDGGYYSSYAMTVKGDKLYFIFNDSGKNLFLKEGDKIAPFKLTGKEALITLATVESDGTVHREALLSPEKGETITRPKACVQTPDDQLFMFATRRDDYRFGLVTFE